VDIATPVARDLSALTHEWTWLLPTLGRDGRARTHTASPHYHATRYYYPTVRYFNILRAVILDVAFNVDFTTPGPHRGTLATLRPPPARYLHGTKLTYGAHYHYTLPIPDMPTFTRRLFGV